MDPQTDQDFLYSTPLNQRVYGILRCNEARRCVAITTRLDLLDLRGDRKPFEVALMEDQVTILWVAGHLVRQVWVGYVRSLCLSDLVAAIPSATVLVDQLRVDRRRERHVRTVRTAARDRLVQEVEVVSVVALFAAADRVGFDGDVGGKTFWQWAKIFRAEWHVFRDLLSFRLHSDFPDHIDHPFLRPAPSGEAIEDHRFGAWVLAHFPTHDWIRLSNGTRPIPAVLFAEGEVERAIAHVGAEAARNGRSAAIAAIGCLRRYAHFLNDAPMFEGHSLLTRIERGRPYVWMGSIEDALGFWIPVGLVDPVTYPAHGTVDGDLTFYEVDPYAPTMLRRNHEGGRGRSARTTAWILLDGVRDMLARVRADSIKEKSLSEEKIAKIGRLDLFSKIAVCDLEVYLRETVDGLKFGSPTDTGREVVVDLEIEGVTFSILFDALYRQPWLTYEQASLIFAMSVPALQMAMSRLRAKGILGESDSRLRRGRTNDDKSRDVSYLSWAAVLALAPPTSIGRYLALTRWIGFVTGDAMVGKPQPLAVTYHLADFESGK